MKNPKSSRYRLRAMTLTEMLIVLAIIGILVLMAYPILKGLISKTHYTEAKTNLTTICTLQKGYFAEHSKFTMDLKETGFEQEKLVTDEEDGKAHYKLEMVEATNQSFKARATAITDFDGDGQFSVFEIDEDCVPKMITED